MVTGRDLREEILEFIAEEEDLQLTQKRFGFSRERLKEIISGKIKPVEIYIDGAARGNPGPSGAGVVFVREGRIIQTLSKSLGRCTNNQAEYLALIHALEMAKSLGYKNIVIKTDSQLVARQIRGLYRIKNGILLKLAARVKELLSTFDNWDLVEIPRNENQDADRLAKDASRAREGDRVSKFSLRDEESPDSTGHGTS